LKRFVLDCSVTMAWCFENEVDPRADALLDSMKNATACVPCLWALEVANVLLVGERRERLTEADVISFLSRLQQMPIEQEPAADPESIGRVLALARHHGLSAYDATYLEQAMRLGIPLATLDTRLQAAAQAAGVTLALR
jgi:predicted nucleic acid-binding protein